MKIERTKLTPESWLTQVAETDCFWVSFKSREAARAIESPTFQFIDWRLQGLVSKFLMQNLSKTQTTTFVPVKTTLPFSFLALEPSSTPDWPRLEKNCEGQQWRNVFLFFEDVDAIAGAEKELKRAELGKFPALIHLASDA
jgi:hypothetical protein